MLGSQINQFSTQCSNPPNKPRHSKDPGITKMDVSALVPFDGRLSKYTNVMKGWQNRYFLLNPQNGILEYFVNQSEALSAHYKPRGSLVLAGAVIAPSTEDSYTFSVNAANGEVYKLRASNAKERQEWVSRLRTVVQHFSSQIAQEHPPLAASGSRKPRTRSVVSNMSNSINKIKDQVQQLSGPQVGNSSVKHSAHDDTMSVGTLDQQTGNSSSMRKNRQRSDSRGSNKGMLHRTTSTETKRQLQHSDLKQMQDARQALVSSDNYHAGLVSMLDSLNFHSDNKTDSEKGDVASVGSDDPTMGLSALDKDVLLMKSTSGAMLQSLSNCYSILQKYHQQITSALPPDAQIQWMESKQDTKLHMGSHHHPTDVSTIGEDNPISFETPKLADPADEVEDSSSVNEEDLGPVDEHKNVIMHLLSQLKLGMDLTRVTLPTFILEKRSLLEMYADFLGHSNLLLEIPTGKTPYERMHKVIKFYLTSFHSGRQGQITKKPYNPIVGEVFQCSYYIPNQNTSEGLSTEKNNGSTKSPPSTQTHSRIQFIAEQVSHHPPVSAFYTSCSERGIEVNSHIWTRSKFMNMSVGVVNIGEGTITLTDFNEHYVMTYPSAYARSILTVPWSELGGRCTITCEETGLTANIVFHTKPMYGGMPHRVTGEVKDQNGFVSCRVQGKWNGELEFSYYNEDNQNTPSPTPQHVELIDTNKLQIFPKYVRPMEAQDMLESRKLWTNVTQSLKSGDVTAATEHKSILEDQQREIERQRHDANLPVPTAYFTQTKGKDYDTYAYKKH
uniref:Oxysterol-binding protein n=1 Tax=Phallusia mammillata TaxID=59560 RepID=A0A6F9DN17_9ASCI|nr:oxysterol-binding protein-related protein 11-like [Phallusia mammillata]